MSQANLQEIFSAFERELRLVLAANGAYRETIDKAVPIFARLLQDERLVPEAYRTPLPDRYAQYLLYKPADEAFSVVAFVWGPGQTAPVHDHRVWGLVGVWQGQIEETRYRRKERSDGQGVTGFLEEVRKVQPAKGDITFVYPPDHDIHGVSNPFGETAVTVHLYGTDIGKQERFVYDPATSATKPIVTRHRNELPIYSFAEGALG